MKLDNFLRKECISLNAKPKNKYEVLAELSKLAKKCPKLDHISEENLLKTFENREQLCSTSFSKGIAIPHCHFDSLDDFVIGILTVEDGVPFDTPDDEDVSLFVFVIGPAKESAKYFKVISSVSEILRTKNLHDNVLKASSEDEAVDIFLKNATGSIDHSEVTSKSYIRIYVENEDYFRDILQIMVAMEMKFLTVTETQPPSKYLAKLPLFAGDYNVSQNETTFLITGVVESSLVNETIRRIESITGTLDKQNEVLVTTQEINYTVGNFDM